MKNLILLLGFLIIGANSSQAQDAQLVAKGAKAWAANCTRCHNARSPLERSARDWSTIVNHMRARANLTKSEALSISAYFSALAPKTNYASLRRSEGAISSTVEKESRERVKKAGPTKNH